MRISIQRRGLVPGLVVAVLGTVLLYLASTRGVTAWNTSRATPVAGAGVLPDIVENAPPTVPTTGAYGPIGAVALVFAGTDVNDGLLGALDQPWIAVASHGGDYRAIDAPDLPAAGPGAMSVSHDGNLLAWPGGAGVIIYDAVTAETTELSVDGVDQVGAFAPDNSALLAQGEELSVVDIDNGDVLATAPAGPESLTRAAWRPDSTAVDFVSGTELHTLGVGGAEVSSQPTEIPEQASLAWSPTGDRLVSLRPEDGGVNRLYLSGLAPDGSVAEGERVATEGVSLQRLVGFSGERTVAVVAFMLESGSVERILDIPLDGRSPSGLTTLPSPGSNWLDSSTLAIASDNLVAGSASHENPLWPWSYAARLVACILTSAFLFGLFATRRKRRR